MNYIDVAPPCLALFAQALDQNPNIKVRGTVKPTSMSGCRFDIDVSAIYDGPPCQWTCEFSIDKGQTTTTFKPCELGR